MVDDDKLPPIPDEGSPVLDILADLGGLPIPKPVKRNILKAFGQLITSGADIGVAWFEAFAQAIRTEANAKSIVTLKAAGAAGRKIEKDPNLIDRAVQAYGNRIVGEQANREAVARAAVDELRQRPPPEHGPKEIDDDWLYRFSRFAEGVSNEEMQKVWGRVLAHQVVKPGAYSIRALSTLAVMDHDDARMFQFVVNHLYDLEDGRSGVIIPFQYRTDLGKQIKKWWRERGMKKAVEHLETLGLTRAEAWTPHLNFPNGTTEMKITISGIPFKVRKQPNVDTDTEFGLGPHYEMTRLGNELRQLMTLETQPAYIRNVFAALSNNENIEFIPLDDRGKEFLGG